MLTIDRLSFSYGTKQVLDDLSLKIEEGEIVTIVGKSGAGKTTLFRLIVGLLEPQQGKILIRNNLTNQHSRFISYMMQEDLLLPWRTVLRNVELAVELSQPKKQKGRIRSSAIALLEQMDLHNCISMIPCELSEGMRQRVALARSLLQNRPILLFDEPFGALDTSLREKMYSLLLCIRRTYNKTMLLITHDFRDALVLSDTIYLLAKGRLIERWSIGSDIKDDPRLLYHTQEQLKQALMKY